MVQASLGIKAKQDPIRKIPKKLRKVWGMWLKW
jgi:hypothetical protein